MKPSIACLLILVFGFSACVGRSRAPRRPRASPQALPRRAPAIRSDDAPPPSGAEQGGGAPAIPGSGGGYDG